MVEFHKTKNLIRIIQIMVQSLQFLKGRSYNVKVLLQNLEIIIAINSLLRQMAEVLATPSQVEDLVLPAVAANFPANFQNRRPAKEIRGRCPVVARAVLAETETETASIESRFQN